MDSCEAGVLGYKSRDCAFIICYTSVKVGTKVADTV